jgi:hypothetical protein
MPLEFVPSLLGLAALAVSVVAGIFLVQPRRDARNTSGSHRHS